MLRSLRLVIKVIDLLKWPAVVAFGLWMFHRSASDWAFTILTSDRIRIADTLKVIVWPLVVAAGLLAFKRPLSAFLEGIGQRVTKFSVFKVEVELTAAEHQLRPLAVAVVDELKEVRANDSAAGLLRVVAEAGPADYATIDLGKGDQWLTSRLFILAVMLQRMRSTRCVVFVATQAGEAGRFVGVAPLPTLRWSLARAYPWLEATFAYAYAAELARANSFDCVVQPVQDQGASQWYDAGEIAPRGSAPIVMSETGRLEATVANQIVRRYIAILETRGPNVGDDGSWTGLSNNRVERAAWVSPASLVTLLDAELQDSTVHVSRIVSRSAAADELMRQRDDFIAILGHRRRFKGLIDRRALLAQAAAKAP